MKIVIDTPYVSTNALYKTTRHGRRVKTAPARAAAESMGWIAKDQYRKDPIDGDIFVFLNLFFGDRRRRDVDNTKGILDAMTGILWEDDSQIEDLHSRKQIDLENPRIEIYITKSFDQFIKYICDTRKE